MDRGTAIVLILGALALLVGGFFSDKFGLMCLGAGVILTLNFVDIRRS